jgi:flagellar protein FliO/FliZ
MPGLSESFFANKSFTLVAAALAFLGAAILILMIMRMAFGRGLRMPRNGRTRLPRLGTVDAFDLDRQRQLVIIRRDNVEHLLMIGGPNDLLIESQIIRAESREPRDFREPRVREKEVPLPAGVAWPATAESPSPLPPQRKIPFPPAAAFEPETGGRAGEPEGFSQPAGAAAPRSPGFPIPPRRVASSNQRVSTPRESFQGRADAPPRPDPVSNPAKDFRRASVATPFVRPAPHRATETPAVRLAPAGEESEAPAVVPASPESPHGNGEIPALAEMNTAAETRVEPALPTAEARDVIEDDLGSGVPAAAAAQTGVDTLEVEMAKLLGRRPG